MGLLLGVAIFHLADLINLFLDKRIQGCRKRMGEQGDSMADTPRDKVYQVNTLMRTDSEELF